MSATELPFVADLLADEKKLRTAAGRALYSGPWKHALHEVGYCNHYAHNPQCVARCSKCHEELMRPANDFSYVYPVSCPVPDPAPGPLEVIAAQLVRKVVFDTDRSPGRLHGYIALIQAIQDVSGLVSPSDQFPHWLEWPAAKHAVCCLAALGKARGR